MKRRDEVLVGIVATAALVLAIIGSLYLARGGIHRYLGRARADELRAHAAAG